jgi:hypothetical protein
MPQGQINLVGPIAPIIGAIMGALITAAITYFLVVKRKSLGFWISESEDLTRLLRQHHQQIVVSVGQQGFFNLNRATVLVKNTGNVSIEGFNFDIEIPGEHKGYLADMLVDDEDLRKSITFSTDQPPPTSNPTLHVKVGGFLNPRESFKVGIFFDDATVNCKVRCRIADVKSKVKRGEPIGIREIWRSGVVLELLGVIAGMLVAVGGTVALAFKLFLLH